MPSSNEEVVHRYAEASAAGDLEGLAALRTPDWTAEWPQSGEYVPSSEAELSVRTKLRAKLGLLSPAQISDVLPYLARLLFLKPAPAEEELLGRSSPSDLAREIHRAHGSHRHG